MHPEIAALAESHGLSESTARAFDALFERHRSLSDLSRATFDDRDPVTLLPLEDDALPADRTSGDDHWIAGRYEDLGPLGEGGMGSVRRVRDTVLNRTLALKAVHTHLRTSSSTRARFLEEAQATAQLQHPNILPVHDLGELPDGRLWFTMQEVRGQTLLDVIDEVHAAAASRDRWGRTPTGWSLQRLVATFQSVCNAVAYAHERGVVHRDLKPDNVMVGRHGEVMVLDWGLARIVGREEDWPLADDEAIRTDRMDSDAHRTEHGQVAGTPAYMPPEQARGELDRIGPRTDVYALGAILYEILSGRPPYEGHPRQVLDLVLAGPPAPVSGPPLPEALVDACRSAMARDPDARPATASALAELVGSWLDGSRRQEQARAVVSQTLAGVDDARALERRAEQLQAEGDRLLEGIEPWRPEQDKAAGWAKQDEAAALRRRARLKQLEVDQGLHGALRIAPDLPEAHAALATRYRDRHTDAEADRDLEGAAELEPLVRLHTGALPESHEVRRACTAYLTGDGALTLHTDPPGAEVMLYRYETRTRRLVEVPVRSLGRTPLVEVSLPMGSYLCVVTAEDHAPVRYPIEITRLGHWSGVAPGDSDPTAIWLPPEGYLGDDEVYVPAGWFRAGGDSLVRNPTPGRRLWCDALVAHRQPITNRQYLAFLDDLVAHGRAEDALEWAPRGDGGVDTRGPLLVGYDGQRFSLQRDPEGHLWDPEWPVLQITWEGARAWLQWLAGRTGRPWRLPASSEWEKMARGVDGRWFPWGDVFDASWAHTAASHRGERSPAPVNGYRADESPYGIRGMGGNVEDMCRGDVRSLDSSDERVRIPAPAAPDVYSTTRGGSWAGIPRHARSADRRQVRAGARYPYVGFRGAFSPQEVP